MKNFQTPKELFNAIINNSRVINSLPKELISNIDFIEKYYIILKDEIKPYIPKKVYETLKHREIIFKNKHFPKPKYKPNISLENELNLFHSLLNDLSILDSLTTDEKYNNDFLEFLYLIWGDELENYIPYEMFEELKNEELMRKYHQDYLQKQKDWAEEENQKIKLLSKR